MKKLKLFLCVALFGAMSFGAFSAYDYYTMSAEEKALLENIEALTSGEGFQTIYNRTEGECSIYVGVNGSIKILGGTIIKANAQGYVTFDGKVICHGGGNSSCTPVECKDLYSEIFN